MTYVNGMVVAVPNSNKTAYVDFARKMTRIFQRHGALDIVDCWGVDVPQGQVTSFPSAVKCGPDETVVFSWVTWPDRATADAGMEAAMRDPDMEKLGEMPFDGKRMIYGGFEMLS